MSNRSQILVQETNQAENSMHQFQAVMSEESSQLY